MTQSYTQDDLLAEAARQNDLSSEDHDYVGIGEMMQDAPIPSTVTDLTEETGEDIEMYRSWGQLSQDDFDTAQRAIDKLRSHAPSLSDWGVHIGADNLQVDNDTLTFLGEDGSIVTRVHFAFGPDVNEGKRAALKELTSVVLREN